MDALLADDLQLIKIPRPKLVLSASGLRRDSHNDQGGSAEMSPTTTTAPNTQQTPHQHKETDRGLPTERPNSADRNGQLKEEGQVINKDREIQNNGHGENLIGNGGSTEEEELVDCGSQSGGASDYPKEPPKDYFDDEVDLETLITASERPVQDTDDTSNGCSENDSPLIHRSALRASCVH